MSARPTIEERIAACARIKAFESGQYIGSKDGDYVHVDAAARVARECAEERAKPLRSALIGMLSDNVCAKSVKRAYAALAAEKEARQ